MTNMRPPTNKTLLKVVILGDGGVGKSCLMNRFVANQYDDNSFHTIGVEFLNKDITVEGHKYTLQIWDTAGQERFRALRTPFYRGSDICFLSYAINDKDSFQALMQWREEFLKYADIDADYFPFIVVGNKNDVSSAERQISAEEVAAWCQEFHIAACIETSAKNAVNVEDAFVLAVKQWQKQERHTEQELRNSNGDVIDLTSTVRLEEPNRFCCYGSNDSPARSNRNSSALR